MPTALRGTTRYPHADAYGVNSDTRHLIIQMKTSGTFGPNLRPNLAWEVVEVTFDEADVFGSYPLAGHPGVIGLWLNDYTEGDAIDSDGISGDVLRTINPLDYTVPDLRPTPAGYMFQRGYVWAPGARGGRAYP
jgi:hypothetical protein